MMKSSLRFLLIALVLLAPLSAKSQEEQKALPQPGSSLTPAQAQQALEVLQNDNERGRLIQTLQVIAKASPPAPSPLQSQAAPVPSTDNLGAQLLVQISDWLGDLSGQLAAGARTVSDLPAVWHWLARMAADPDTRDALLDAAWKLAAVLACALAVEWIVRRAISRPLAAIKHYVPARLRLHASQQQETNQQNEAPRSKSGRD